MPESKRHPLDREHPWPALDSFEENDSAFFFGRDAETEELLRLVHRELVTVLFGRSGLGKTSLLKAGLFPRLRESDFLPVYVRLDHAEQAPALREQIFTALFAASDEETSCVGGESLWAYFHRRDSQFWSTRNRPVLPVIVLDQFEELFTIGQETQLARDRSATFQGELGDLIENRPPSEVKRYLEADPTHAAAFDFKRASVKLILSFREDFLAQLEGLNARIPSLMYNRYRLQAMNGGQAYEVVMGKEDTGLVEDEVARCILRLAWKNEPSPPVERSEFGVVEIDPALLSVVCSELNLKRLELTPPHPRITAGLLAGADREILAGFYERAMSGLDPGVRTYVEDKSINDSGVYRESFLAEDALARPGINHKVLDTLIARRLLRVDERQKARRLELAHDVLTRVVRQSRDSRRAREAEEAAKQREQVALAQQRRNRRNATLVLAAGLVVVALLAMTGWFAWRVRELAASARAAQLLATADRLQDVSYDVSLLVSLEAIKADRTLDAQAVILQRLTSHPHLSAFLSGHANAVFGVAFSPDGKQLASASWDHSVIIWDVRTRRALAILKGHADQVVRVAFSPDGRLLASASSDRTIILWDVAKREAVAKLEGHKDEVWGVAFSPDGKQLASASRDHTVVLWDVATRKALVKLEGHKKGASDVAFSPDGRRLASASQDKTVILWDVKTRRALATLQKHEDEVWGVAFSPDGKRLASAGLDNTVVLWDVYRRKLLSQLRGHKTGVFGVAFSPDGKRLASASRDDTLILWDGRTYEALESLKGHKHWAFGVAFSPDGRQLASASWDNTVILWDVDRRKALSTLEGHQNAVWNVAFGPEGKQLASASRDKTVIIWDVKARQRAATLQGHTDEVWGVAFNPRHKQLASASKDKTVILWNLQTGLPTATLDGHKNAVSSVAFAPDGERLASASKDKTVILWDVDNHQVLATLQGHKDDVWGVAFSPDGKLLASASRDNTVMLWDVNTHKNLAVLAGHKTTVVGVAFSPNGERLASASRDNNVIIWDVEKRKALATLEGHTNEVLAVSFSPDGKRLASASSDNTVILWDADTGKALATLPGHKDEVFSVAFSPDGKHLASASKDNTVILWDIDPDSLRVEACRTANRNLTCKEWREYIDVDKTYHRTCETFPGPEQCEPHPVQPGELASGNI